MNIEIFRFFNDFAGKNNFLDKIVLYFTEYSVFALALFMLIGFFYFSYKKNYKQSSILFFGGISFILSFVLCKIVGKFYYNAQPFFELDNVNQLVFKEVNNSFPSDHTALFFSVIFTFFLLNKRYWVILILPFLMGISRIYVGVHYPLDVFVAALIGILVSILSTIIFIKFEAKIIFIFKHLLNKINIKKAA